MGNSTGKIKWTFSISLASPKVKIMVPIKARRFCILVLVRTSWLLSLPVLD